MAAEKTNAVTSTSGRPLVLGTAGHIDHGKTALIKALTGVDCDRLKEEKARGITIELGFAQLVTPSGCRVSVVDVPGHEKFVRTMIAGAGAIDIALLVVAADEGVMPQTIEHIAICDILEIAGGVVALTKCDLVNETLLDARRDELAKALAGTVFEKSPCVPVSAISGAGLSVLVSEIDSICRIASEVGLSRRDELPTRLAVDRVFSMAGFGVVVTGTLATGLLRVGDEVEILPGKSKARIRGLEVHGDRVESAACGVRVAVNLQGLDKSAISRGVTIAAPGHLFETQTIDVEMVHLPFAERPLPQNAQLAFHLGTSSGLATARLVGTDHLDPGQRAHAQLFIDRPIVAAGGDRFVLRGTVVLENYGKTVGGGVVLDAQAPIIRKRSRVEPIDWKHLHAGTLAERIAVVAGRAAEQGMSEGATCMRLGLTAAEWRAGTRALESDGKIVRIGETERHFVSQQTVTDLLSRMLETLDAFHRASPLKDGLPIRELQQKLHIGDTNIMSTVLAWGEKQKRVERHSDRVSLPGRANDVRGKTASLRESIVLQYQTHGLASPRIREVSETLKIPVGTVEGIVANEIAEGRLLRIAADLVVPADEVKKLEARLMQHLDQHGSITTQAFKELAGVTRKYAIPLAEYFDARRVTLRVGDKRVPR